MKNLQQSRSSTSSQQRHGKATKKTAFLKHRTRFSKKTLNFDDTIDEEESTNEGITKEKNHPTKHCA